MKKTVFIIIGLIGLIILLINLSIFLFNRFNAWVGITAGIFTFLVAVYIVLTAIEKINKKNNNGEN